MVLYLSKIVLDLKKKDKNDKSGWQRNGIKKRKIVQYNKEILSFF
jgi:hypothetical protein